jgi:hypothetical protein
MGFQEGVVNFEILSLTTQNLLSMFYQFHTTIKSFGPYIQRASGPI